MVNQENTLLAEILQEVGFHTVGFVASFALESRFDIAQGFDHYDETFSVLVGEDYADQNQRDYEAFKSAADAGRVEATYGM